MPKDNLDSSQLLGEISQAPSAFEQFLERNQKGIFALAILAALGGCGVVVYRSWFDGVQREAGAALVKSEDVNSLQSLVKEYPKTEAAGSAAVLIAEKEWAEGRQEDSIKTLQEFIQTKPNHPARASAQASLGSKLANQGKKTEAVTALQAVVDNPAAKYLAPYALTQLGDLAKADGDLDKAKSYYEKAKNDYSGNQFGNVAGQHLLELNAKPPVEIDAPPAPAADVPPVDLMNPGAPQAPFSLDAPPAPVPASPEIPAAPGQ